MAHPVTMIHRPLTSIGKAAIEVLITYEVHEGRTLDDKEELLANTSLASPDHRVRQGRAAVANTRIDLQGRASDLNPV